MRRAQIQTPNTELQQSNVCGAIYMVYAKPRRNKATLNAPSKQPNAQRYDQNTPHQCAVCDLNSIFSPDGSFSFFFFSPSLTVLLLFVPSVFPPLVLPALVLTLFSDFAL
jgi:hypothetical protein